MPQSDPSSSEAASSARDFVFWPEENGGKRTEADLRAVARTLSGAEAPSLEAASDEPGESRQETTIYPATSAWRRTTSRVPTVEQERWWEVGPSLAGATVGAPQAEPRPPAVEPLLTPDEIWEMTARELAEAPVLRTKAQAPAAEQTATPIETVSADFEPVVRQLSASLRASPFAFARRAAMPISAVDAPKQAIAPTHMPVEFQEEIVFRRARANVPARPDTEQPDFESAPARPLFTFWRLVLLLILGVAVSAILCRDQLSGLDWRGMWAHAMHNLASITKPPPPPPVRKAVPISPPAKPSARAAGDENQLIESPARPAVADPPALPSPPAAKAAPAVVDPAPEPSPAADDGQDPRATGRPGPVGESPQPPESDDVGAESASSTLWSGDDPAAMSQTDKRAQSGGQKSRLSAADQSQAAEAQAAVQNLIAADSMDKVLPWIFEPDKLGSMVRDYHALHPLGALTSAVVELEYSGVIPSSGAKAFIFNVLHPDHPRGFPVSAEHTPEGYRIDWQSYIQWRDEWLRRFVEKKTTEPQMLFVVLRRAHYFNDDVPRLDDKLCFKISSAVPGDEGTFAFVDHPSALGRSLAETYEWRKLYFPVVEVQWVRGPNSAAYVRLNRIVRPTWRRVGD